MKRRYYQCVHGRYYAGVCCPFDGSMFAGAELVPESWAEEEVSADFLPGLREAGHFELANRSVLFDFGSPTAAFRAIAPMVYSQVNWQAPKMYDRGFPSGFDVCESSCVLIVRCNGGHYGAEDVATIEKQIKLRGFSGCCPFDGWTVPELSSAAEAFAMRVAAGEVPDAASLSPYPKIRARLIVAQFADPKRAFRGMAPLLYVGERSPALIPTLDIPVEYL